MTDIQNVAYATNPYLPVAFVALAAAGGKGQARMDKGFRGKPGMAWRLLNRMREPIPNNITHARFATCSTQWRGRRLR